MIVLDASAGVRLLLDEGDEQAKVCARLSRPGTSIHVPHLFDVELLHAFRRYRFAGMEPGRINRGIRRFKTLRLTRYPHRPLVDRIWSLRDNLSAYDATYLALAETLRAPLITFDARLGGAPGHLVEIEVL